MDKTSVEFQTHKKLCIPLTQICTHVFGGHCFFFAQTKPPVALHHEFKVCIIFNIIHWNSLFDCNAKANSQSETALEPYVNHRRRAIIRKKRHNQELNRHVSGWLIVCYHRTLRACCARTLIESAEQCHQYKDRWKNVERERERQMQKKSIALTAIRH